LERWRQFRQYFYRRFWPAVIVFGDNDRLSSLLYFHGDDLFFEHARFRRCFCGLLASERICVRVRPGDSRLCRQFFRGHGHGQTAIGIDQAYEKKIFESAGAEFESGARSPDHKWRLRHIFHSTSEHHVCFA